LSLVRAIEACTFAIVENLFDGRRRRESSIVNLKSDAGQLFYQWRLQVCEVCPDRHSVFSLVSLALLARPLPGDYDALPRMQHDKMNAQTSKLLAVLVKADSVDNDLVDDRREARCGVGIGEQALIPHVEVNLAR
jgi:hypothetical protein